MSGGFGQGLLPVWSDPGPRYQQSPSALVRRTNTGLLLAVPSSEEAVELRGSGVAIWDVLAHAIAMTDLVDALATAFGRLPEDIWHSVESTVSELVAMSAVVEFDVR